MVQFAKENSNRKNFLFCHRREECIAPTMILMRALCNTSHHSHLVKTDFYAFNSDKIIQEVTSQCSQCNYLKKIPKAIFEQISNPSPQCAGVSFSADVLHFCLVHQINVTQGPFSLTFVLRNLKMHP